MELSLSELESLAEVSGIDDVGREYLIDVVEGVEEAYTDYHGRSDEFSDLIHEVVDNALSVYTYKIWETFIGLSAWEEDVSECGTEDMTQAASWAIYAIGERLANAVWCKLQEEEEEEEEEEEGESDNG